MSIDETRVVDVASIDANTGEVVLTITDHLPWQSDGHLKLFQDKLNCYLAFIESGEILESYPDASGKSVRIDVVCKYAPDIQAESFLVRSAGIIRNGGYALSWRVHPA
jgi:hypothetical protein